MNGQFRSTTYLFPRAISFFAVVNLNHYAQFIMRIICLVLTVFCYNLTTFGQSQGADQLRFENADRTFRTMDTVRISYDLDSLEILHTNFGGCGSGAVYSMVCHSDSLWSRAPQPSCDLYLMEYWYANDGHIEIVIDVPGIYSVVFFVKGQGHQDEERRFRETLSTPLFEIKAK
jgi:hypothetical protein